MRPFLWQMASGLCEGRRTAITGTTEIREQTMARCLIGCGSNLGQRREQLDRAIELLRFMPGVTLHHASRYRETLAIGGPIEQSPFLNGACLIETDLPPQDVMQLLAAVENTLHRERGERWGPRTIDLDLLLYDDLVLETETLTLPHPRMSTRRFVLEPCVEIAPDVEHPQAGCTLRDLLENICQQHLHLAVAGVPGSGASEVATALADATLWRLVHAPAPLPALEKRSPAADAAGVHTQLELAWHNALVAQAQPLLTQDWPEDSHGTISDYWLETLPLASQDSLTGASRDRFENSFDRVAAATVVPHVVILLVTSPAVLEERIAFRNRHAGLQTDVFADLNLGPDAYHDVAALVRLQERLVCRLRSSQRLSTEKTRLRPKAVVMIDSSDIGQAALNAVAAVEAMA